MESKAETLNLAKTLEKGYGLLASVLMSSEAPRLHKMARRLVKILEKEK